MGGLVKPKLNKMKQYIGTKLVSATPAIRKGGKVYSPTDEIPKSMEPVEEGYKVIYEDGYESWSPKDVFEKAYRPCDGMNFGLAIEALKQGKYVTRKGWNGKGMFLWLKPGTNVKAEWCKDPKLYDLAMQNGGEIEALGTICIFTAQKQILSGWLASQTDMLAEDWMILE